MSTKAYLSFTKRERIGILTLAVLLLIMTVLPHFIPKPAPVAEIVPVVAQEKKSDSSWNRNYERPYYRDHRNYTYPDYGARKFRYKKRSYSDSSNYRRPYSNGNYYRNNEGEGKPYVHYDRNKINRNSETNYSAHYQSRYSPSPLDINTADTTAFIALPGLGSKLALRIVSFREKLGGFSHVAQIKEVYGLRDSVYQKLLPYLRCDSLFVRKPLLSYNTFR